MGYFYLWQGSNKCIKCLIFCFVKFLPNPVLKIYSIRSQCLPCWSIKLMKNIQLRFLKSDNPEQKYQSEDTKKILCICINIDLLKFDKKRKILYCIIVFLLGLKYFYSNLYEFGLSASYLKRCLHLFTVELWGF